MSENELELKTIFELLDEKFVIPSYQRGYRWKKAQVTALLDHILEFSQNKKEGEFYCLQPIVVKEISDESNGEDKKEKCYEVIDGQQRLTTISIILRWFMEEPPESRKEKLSQKDIFSISYETRKESKGFLEKIASPEKESSNIDFYHMEEAYKAVSEWGTKTDKKNDFIKTLVGQKGTKSVQVIWYEVKDTKEDPNLSYDLFTRLNIGKISLTNAELIKALFLKKWGSETESVEDKYFSIHQIKIASEWDMIEKTLQNDAFWYFISNSTSYITRIEYIFDLMMENTNHEKDRELRYTFNEFYKVVNSENDKGVNPEEVVEEIWKKIKGIFYQFETWYHDRELYHIIGFMIETGTSIAKILEKQTQRTKLDFKHWLKDTIKNNILPISDIAGLKYGDKYVSEILLLFNIVTIIQNDKSSMKFPFDLYKNKSKNEGWDIEHIHSQVKKEDFNKDEVKEWIELFSGLFTEKETLDKSKENINISIKENNQKIDEPEFNERFKKLLREIENYLGGTIEANIDRLGNLVLLDSGTNRSYKNAWFPFKRTRILEEDSKGTFVPIATKNVFMKAYSSSLTNTLKWEESDMTNYEDKIISTLESYLNGEENGK